MNWLHAALVLAALAGTSGATVTTAYVALSPTAVTAPLTLPPKAHTGFDCLFPDGDRWEPCSNYPHLEANI